MVATSCRFDSYKDSAASIYLGHLVVVGKIKVPKCLNAANDTGCGILCINTGNSFLVTSKVASTSLAQ